MKTITTLTNKIISIAMLLAILGIMDSCTKSADNPYSSGGNTGGTGNKGGPGTNEVWIQGMAFSPASITVTAGTTITWTNKDAVVHTVTSDTNLFDSGSVSTNGTFSHTFATSGTYPYHCTIHPSMTATVVVN
ncbi:MAG: cupredoxin family copper-binding protein [Bacteroidota bacterium]|nr:cupredoxin family copper-binding protein [Bacteroidota bacterium]